MKLHYVLIGFAIILFDQAGAFALFSSSPRRRSTSIFAKKKKPSPKDAALAALELLEASHPNTATAATAIFEEPEELSGKELKRLAKLQAKMKKVDVVQQDVVIDAGINSILNEAEDSPPSNSDSDSDFDSDPINAKKSKKELKAEQKDAEKKAVKVKKNKKKQVEDSDITLPSPATPGPDSNQSPTPNPTQTQPQPQTLEEKIRKSRPPPRVRLMDGVQPGFVSLKLDKVELAFGNQEVLKDASWEVKTGDRIGLVGANGGGKTTQLNILGGLLEPTSGDVVKSSLDLRVATLRQEFVDELVLTRTLKAEFLSVFTAENELLNQLKLAEKELEGLTGGEDDSGRMQLVLDNMSKLQMKADSKDAFNLDTKVSKIMDLMGFTPEEGEQPVSSFSGGWKMRIGLGKVLLCDPNILLLDEPTNHLDMDSVEWLETFLKNQAIPLVIVSHDREFLDQVCTKIVDTANGVSTAYEGNYNKFLKLKKEKMDSWESNYNQQEKKMKEEKAWIQKMKAKQPVAVKQRQAKMEKLVASPDYIKRPPFEGKPFKFRFPDAPRLSSECCTISSLTHGYNGRTLFKEVNLEVEKADRIAVLGPNGSGKSTLLRLIMGKEEPASGEARITGMNVVANYFEQNQADALDLNLTVEETVEQASTNQSYNDLRKLMGQFLFKGDSVNKKVGQLSGGEKARLSLCVMMLRPANLLVLDEPTNHLDIPAKEMLEEALQFFDGAMLLISHDRYFISKVATTICAVEDKKLEIYAGDYKLYMQKNKELQSKVEGRYLKNGGVKIEDALVPLLGLEEGKKSFGGKAPGVSGRLDKGVKNAKRKK